MVSCSRVVIDTNILMLPAQKKLDIFSELDRLLGKWEGFVLKGSIEELERIARGRGKSAIEARVALELIKRKGLKVMEHEGPVDRTLEGLAERGFIVVTNDVELRRRIRFLGGRVIGLKHKKLEVL